MKQVKQNLFNALNCIEKIIDLEDFPAYRSIQKGLISSIESINNNNIELAKKHLSFCLRLLNEAPPKNSNLGYEALIQMDAAFKLINSIN
jgi:hypothetical protein